jgi:hypothetical protein
MGDPNVEADYWDVHCDSRFTLGGTANFDITGAALSAFIPVQVSGSTPSGWASYNYASFTTSGADFTGVYNLVGPSVTLPFYHSLGSYASGGYMPPTNYGVASTVDCYDARPVELILPANVTCTSASGVFLRANSSAMMSTLPSGVENYYNNFLDAYTAISSGTVTWLLKKQDFPESLDIEKAIDVTLKGGYDGIFGTNSGNYSTVQGITIGAGSLIVENVVII